MWTLRLRKPVPTGVVIGAFGAVRPPDALHRGLGQRRAGALHHLHASLLNVPIDLHSCSVNRAAGGRGQLRSDSVAGNQRHFVRHEFVHLDSWGN